MSVPASVLRFRLSGPGYVVRRVTAVFFVEAVFAVLAGFAVVAAFVVFAAFVVPVLARVAAARLGDGRPALIAIARSMMSASMAPASPPCAGRPPARFD